MGKTTTTTVKTSNSEKKDQEGIGEMTKTSNSLTGNKKKYYKYVKQNQLKEHEETEWFSEILKCDNGH